MHPNSRGFRPLPSGVVPGISAKRSASPVIIEIPGSYPIHHVRAFNPVDGPTMPSADFCLSIETPHDAPSPKANRQTSPGNAHPLSRLCPPHIRPRLPCSYWTLKIFAFSSDAGASYAIPVRRASALPKASFRFHLAMDTLDFS